MEIVNGLQYFCKQRVTSIPHGHYAFDQKVI